MQLICYTYQADHHCLDCTREDFPGITTGNCEEYRDSEGNHPHPMFDIEEWYANDMYEGNENATLACGSCGNIIDTWESAA